MSAAMSGETRSPSVDWAFAPPDSTPSADLPATWRIGYQTIVEPKSEIEMRDGTPFYRCRRCSHWFAFGNHRYEGKTLGSGELVCSSCAPEDPSRFKRGD